MDVSDKARGVAMNGSRLALTGVLLAGAALALAAEERAAATDMAWIAGHWCTTAGSEHIEEYWIPARGGMLLGLSRTVKGGRAVGFEFMRIMLAGEGAPAFIAQPNGGAPVTFRWSAGGADWARFENPTHDFPKRVEYRRQGDNLRAQVAGPGENGEERAIPFEYEPCRR